MCWKCCLCLCSCSATDSDADQTNADINRMIDADQAKLKQLGVRSVEDKNWIKFTVHQRTYFIHGSRTGPAIIRDSGSLDPAFGRETCKVLGVEGKYLLGFPCKGNQVPDAVKLSGAAAVLWGAKEFAYMYIFHVDDGTDVYQSEVPGKDQIGAREGAETGFPVAVPWAQIDRVFQHDEESGSYIRNRNFG